MAKGILAGEPLSRNDLHIIVQILEQSFDYCINHNPSFFPKYLQAMRTLAGLGLTAALVDDGLFHLYQTYFAGYLIHEEREFKTRLGKSRVFAQTLAKMIRIASLCFYMLKFPRYYQDFVAALGIILKTPDLSAQKEAERILDCLKIS